MRSLHRTDDWQGMHPHQDPAVEKPLSIGDLARLTGIHIKAIRYYEEVGLLPPPKRGSNGYRSYTQADVHRVNLLRRLRFLGTSLAEARPVLAETAIAPCQEVQEHLLQLVNARLVELDQEIADLIELRAQVQQCQQRLASRPTQSGEPFVRCFDGSCLACGRLPLEEEQQYAQRRKSQGFYEE